MTEKVCVFVCVCVCARARVCLLEPINKLERERERVVGKGSVGMKTHKMKH